jgi:hypothetical protein
MAVQPQKRARVPGGLAKVEQSLSELLIADTESNVMKLLRILQEHISPNTARAYFSEYYKSIFLRILQEHITAIDLKPFCEKVYHSADIRSHAKAESPITLIVQNVAWRSIRSVAPFLRRIKLIKLFESDYLMANKCRVTKQRGEFGSRTVKDLVLVMLLSN